MVVYVPSLIGMIGAFALNLSALILLIKYNNRVKDYNKKYPVKKKEVRRVGVAIYFAIWIVVSLIAWYVLHFIQLGEFFTVSVVLPCVIVHVLEWLQIIR